MRRPWIERAARTAHVAALVQWERRLPWWPWERIERIQRRRVASMVAHAYEFVPFYREEMRRGGLTPADFATAQDLSKLPLIDPAVMRAEPERFDSERVPEHRRLAIFTSGSESKAAGTVYWEHASITRSFASAERDRAVLVDLAGERRSRAVLRELIGRGAKGSRLARLGDPDGGHQRISIFPTDLSSRTVRVLWSEQTLIPPHTAHHHFFRPTLPFGEAVDRFNEIRPRVAYSFGSYVDQFLRYVADREPDIALPRLWVYGGDMVSDHGYELASRLGVRLYSVYSAVEADRIGFHCERGEGHHLNVDLCPVRLVDAEGRTVPDGVTGDVVVSNLRNRATVVLNYRLGDRGSMSAAPCPCGRTLPLLATLEGRRSEVVTLADGRRLSLLVLQGLFREQLKSAIQAQLREVAPGHLRWRLVPRADVDRAELAAAFQRAAAERLGETVLEIEFADDIERTARGKFRQVVA
jgi:phenylacetate-CoA ligase